ncbi:hypothetical protein SAMN02746065_101277 [Desulfocicer vacuolatum DSM 3385]|uniref:Uncharacterized protein n=1 Tax=Desulfocicer vacuolatum DSM 3385 TaxID=1121400 RepID=A0A1W1YR81_9BACT|nr:DUF1302 family protein [Desulfocicer vacuolatum]SMC38715.1 hypothetical protein SAMN02746065_101277 [Desulfocicer vacuolatum DSM 3385]
MKFSFLSRGKRIICLLVWCFFFMVHWALADTPGELTSPNSVEALELSGGFDNFGELGEFDVFETFDGDDTFQEEIPTETEKSFFLKDLTLTFAHDLSWAVQASGSEVVTNRSSLRWEFDRSFGDGFFVKFDAGTSLYLQNDHVADAEGKSAVVDGKIREFYIQAGFDKWMIRAGKQVVVWGETDGDVINDVISPRDLSEFVFMDLEDARLGQYMLSMDYYSKLGDFFWFFTLDPGFNDNPSQGTRYFREKYPFVVILDRPHFFHGELGVKWKKIYDKFEISLMTASLLGNDRVVVGSDGEACRGVYGRYNFYGVGASYTIGSFLFKMDIAFKKDFLFQSMETLSQYSAEQGNVWDTAFAMEYDANGRYVINIELTNRYIVDYTSEFYGVKKNNTGLYFQYNKSFFRDTLTIEYVCYSEVSKKNAFHKIGFDYDFSDDIEFSMEYVFFQAPHGDSFLWNHRNEDRVGLELKFYY